MLAALPRERLDLSDCSLDVGWQHGQFEQCLILGEPRSLRQVGEARPQIGLVRPLPALDIARAVATDQASYISHVTLNGRFQPLGTQRQSTGAGQSKRTERTSVEILGRGRREL